MATKETARERELREIEQEARKYAARWPAWGAKLNAALDTLTALMEEREQLHADAKELHTRARKATVKYRGDLTAFEAEKAKDYMAVKRAIDSRYAVHPGLVVTVVGIPTTLIGFIEQAVKDRAVKQKTIRIETAEHEELRRNRGPALRVEQPGYGVYVGVTDLPPSNGGKGDAEFAHETKTRRKV